MSIATPYYRLYELPWSPGEEAEARFRRILRNLFIAYAVFAVLIPLLPVIKPDKMAAPKIPDRIIQLIVSQPKPPPSKVEPLPAPKAEPEVARVEPKPVPVAKVKPEPVPVDRKQQVREKAQRSGLLAFADDLADLRDDKAVTKIAGAQAVTGAVGEATRNERSLLTSRVGQGSGGINTAAMSRNTGGAGLRSRGTTQVTSAVASMAGQPDEARTSGSGKASRSREEIEMVFDQNKGAIYALYNRALRSNPALQGKLVLKLTIEPTGKVSDVQVVSSELGDEELERKLVQRIRMFSFAAKDVPSVTTTKPIDFFPA